MTELRRKIYITEYKTGFTYFGDLSFFTSEHNEISVLLKNVDVYEYSSSNYLHSISHIKLIGQADDFHIEDAV